MKKHLTIQQWLILIIAAGVLLRIAASFIMGDQVNSLPGIQDQVSYDALARRILHGFGYSFPKDWYPFTYANKPTAHWSFAYPLFLAGVYCIFGEHPLAARILQSLLCGSLTSLLIFAITRRLTNNPRTGLIAAALTACYGYFIYYNAALMTESFFIVGILSALYFSLRLLEKPSGASWVLLGAALGISALLRQTALFLAPLLLAWLIFEHRRRIDWKGPLLTLAVMGLLILPWTVRNYIQFHTFLLLNSNSGYALYAATGPHLGTTWSNDGAVVPIPQELIRVSEPDKDRALTALAVKNVLDNPARIFLLTISKGIEFLKFWPSPDSGLLSNVVRVASFGLYLPFMLWGLLLSLRNWRGYLPIYLTALIFAALHILSWPAPRYRLPSDAVFMILAALAVSELLRLLEQWRKPANYAAEVKG